MIWLVYGGLRYSRDLDFNLYKNSEKITEEKLRKIIKKAFGKEEFLKSYRESNSFINAEISFPGITIPLGIKIKIEITVPYQYLDELKTHYFSFPEYALGSFAYKILSIESVIADKIKGLFKRKNPINIIKDAFDLWFLIKVKGYSTTKRHINHIFSITNMEFDISKLRKRLNEARKKKNEFKQYLLPSFKGDFN